MIAVPAYYDGVNIKPLEEIHIKRNQKIILIIMDEFVEKKEKFRFDAFADDMTYIAEDFNEMPEPFKQDK